MTDIPNQTVSTPPDQISWYQSRIIWLQVVGAATAVLALFGHSISPDDQQNLVNILTTSAGIVVTVVTIYHRVAKPCPPVAKTPATSTNK